MAQLDSSSVARTGTKTFQTYIGGEWVDSASGETFESTSPATGESIGIFPRSSAEDVDHAVAAARAAYEEWRLVPAPKRGEVLYRFANLLMEEKDDLTDLMSHEMGKVKAEAGGDVQEAIDMSLYMAGEGRRLFGQTTPSELRDKFNMSVRMPIGVVGVITPWNFPIAIPSWKIAPALISGNTVVLKPATDTPLLGGVACDRSGRRLRATPVAARRGSGEAPPRPGLGRRHRRRSGDQLQGAREDPLVHGDRQRRGRQASDRWGGGHRERFRERDLLPPDDLRLGETAEADC